MFELSVAFKYLIPRRRQLSVSIISLISILVIALVVWLIVVFFSVTNGLEKSWVQKLTALTAPVRITPTDAYHHSYYYLIDSISHSANYSSKTIKEKRDSEITDSYDPESDEEIPPFWQNPDLDSNHSLKDLVKLVYSSIDEIDGVPGLHGQDYELTATHIQLNLLRHATLLHGSNLFGTTAQSELSYPAFLGNFESNNPQLEKTLLPVEEKDLNNLLFLMGIEKYASLDNSQVEKANFPPDILQNRLIRFFQSITIKQLQANPSGWNIPSPLIPSEVKWEVFAIMKDQHIVRLVIPQNLKDIPALQKSLEEQGLNIAKGHLSIQSGKQKLSIANRESQILSRIPLTLAGGSAFNAELDKNSLSNIHRIEDLHFNIRVSIQGIVLQGKVPYRGLEISLAENQGQTKEFLPPWVSKQVSDKTYFVLPKDEEIGEGVVLPKSFRDAGVMIGDRGFLSYLSPTPSMLQEQQIPIYVAGFYDPGIIPIGGKFILANQEVTSLIRSSHQQDDRSTMTNGINVRFQDMDQADAVKNRLLQSFAKRGIQRYWNVETYKEYEFTKEIMRELQSQKHLFMLIAVVIILVACSNIISMLIILVNDKRLEIGILRSMGASSRSIAFIFGFSGALIGILGSAIGIAAALLTLQNLDALVGLLSKMQGHDMFSANLYGHMLPSELSLEALMFVMIVTGAMSLLAGIVPAIKACLMRPSHILRSSGG